MLADQSILKLSFKEALIIFILILSIISFGIIGLKMVPHLPIIAAIVGLLIYGKLKGLHFSVMEKAMAQGAFSAMGAIYIFLFIGMLISSWMMSGTIPTIMYYGFEFLSGSAFYAIAFLIASLVGLCIGSSLTTSATIGVAFIGMAGAMDVSMAITAGAIVSGAFLGDKMSPLSDTCNLASETVGVNLFEHVRNMLWTTVPGFIISFIIYFWLSPSIDSGQVKEIGVFLESLKRETNVSIISLFPFVLVAIMALKKVPAVPTLAAGIISSLVIAFTAEANITLASAGQVLFSGYKLDSGIKELDSILSRGGMESMMFSISLVLLALGMGGLLFKFGIIPALLDKAAHRLKKAGRLITATVCTSIGVNVLIGEQYLSILLPGKTFQASYEKAGLTKKTLARALEDGGTVVNPLIPWGVSGVFLTQVLGVSTMEYAPFAFFCLLCPLLSILSGFSGVGISFKNPQPIPNDVLMSK
ncbi:NhaC family Na+:H+ antiporter [Peribacillus deserti]|uniref:NhaC family Na+:H+ antiporter n=1 Tax=Peribacillus deserti TaxID=673318 RepID=A0ABS2QK69_9BACI|nr:Na+/H+ antiporter NhaC [Peribacillus deserti]MBM7693094.1 NhaC family Na+:H+ antiporter [Peribacillus deserti]